MLAHGRGNHYEVLDRVLFPHSLGILYTAVTQWLGFPYYGDEGKVMGLAPYGRPALVDEVSRLVKLDGPLFELDLDYFKHHIEGVDMTWDEEEPTIGTLYSPKLEELLIEEPRPTTCAVRDARYKLIHNFYPDRSYSQFNEYIKNSYPALTVIQDLAKEGKLNEIQARWVAPGRPEFELYDHQADPHEVQNLAADPAHKKACDRLKKRLDQWIVETNDQGRTPEQPSVIAQEEPRALTVK